MDKAALAQDISTAAAWLCERNRAQAREWGLGEETRFDGDQDAGVLRLRFETGAGVDLPMQILGSFNPSERTFRWAWANTSVDGRLSAAAALVRGWGEANEVAAFTQVSLPAPFDEIAGLVALAAMRAGCDGVYRGVLDDGLSVFIGFAAPTQESGWWPNGRADAAFENQALDLVTAWHRENFAIDKQHHEAREDATDRLLAAKDAVYDRMWRRADDYWRPCSFAWPSDHDPAERIELFATPRRAGGCYVVTRRASLSLDAHVVEETPDGLRITDQNLGWGGGLIWPNP